MERVKRTSEHNSSGQDILRRQVSIIGFATLLHVQRANKNNVVRYFGLQWNIDKEKRKEDEMRALNQPLMAVLANAEATKRWLAAVRPNIEEAVASIERVTHV